MVLGHRGEEGCIGATPALPQGVAADEPVQGGIADVSNFDVPSSEVHYLP